MRSLSHLLLCCALCLGVQAFGQKGADLYSQLSGRRIQLPNQWRLTPAGSSVQLADLPLQIAVSPDGKYLAVT
ncbi:MAG TPA: hypothetical protein PK971_09470, partial [Saprospiraceae bacterium]|nr:hypothetical protein [Saprospiraceae bacterium]